MQVAFDEACEFDSARDRAGDFARGGHFYIGLTANVGTSLSSEMLTKACRATR